MNTAYKDLNALNTMLLFDNDLLNSIKLYATTDICDNIKNLDQVKIKKVLFNPPATIVFWDDGTKTVVVDTDGHWETVQKARKNKRDKKLMEWKEAGLLNAIAKKFYHNYQYEITKWIEKC